MFENILLTFLKAILLTSLLVIAFSLAFFMAFYNPEMDSSVSNLCSCVSLLSIALPESFILHSSPCLLQDGHNEHWRV